MTPMQKQHFRRHYLSQAVQTQLDNQWRVLVPDHFFQMFGRASNLQLIGTGERIEIWNADLIAQAEAANADALAAGGNLVGVY